jgi:hypothetical protein
MLYPGSGYFLIPDPDPNNFSSSVPDPTYMKSTVECKLTFFMLLMLSVLVIPAPVVKKIRIRDQEKIIPDPDNGSRG